MNFPQFDRFKVEIERNIRKTFKVLIKDSEAAEQAVIAKHQKLSGSLESEYYSDSREQLSTVFFSDPVWYKIRMPRTFNKRALIKYAVLSWFLPTHTSWELRETIQSRAREKQFWEIGCYTYSFDCCIQALYQEVDLSHSDLFGNILKSTTSPVRHKITSVTGQEDMNTPYLKRRVTDFCLLELVIPAREKPKVFRRGYNDHGSGQPNHKSGLGEYSEDVELDNLQEWIDFRRAQYSLQWTTRILQVVEAGYT